MSVLIRDLVTAVQHGDAALVGESCGYIVLGAADLVVKNPRRVSSESLTLSEEGTVHLDGPSCSSEEAERSLRVLLEQLLRLARTPCPNLKRVAERADCRGLALVVLELEAALVPVNRRAAKRSLARLARETKRAQAAQRRYAEVTEVEVSESAQEAQESQGVEGEPAQSSHLPPAEDVESVQPMEAPLRSVEEVDSVPPPFSLASSSQEASHGAAAGAGRVQTVTQILTPKVRTPVGRGSRIADLMVGKRPGKSRAAPLSPEPKDVQPLAPDVSAESEPVSQAPETVSPKNSLAAPESESFAARSQIEPDTARHSVVSLQSESISEPLSEVDVFDDLLDECPTQIFHARTETVAEAGPASISPRPTLTPPASETEEAASSTCVGLTEAELLLDPNTQTPVVPVELGPAALPAPTEGNQALHEQPATEFRGVDIGALIVSPEPDPLVLSPCPPRVASSVSADVELTSVVRVESDIADVIEPSPSEEGSVSGQGEVHSLSDVEQAGRVADQPESSAEPKRPVRPFYRPRPRARAPIAEHVSLLPKAIEPRSRRPSDIEELLSRRPPNTRADDQLFAGLQRLSRVDLSPAAPEVTAKS